MVTKNEAESIRRMRGSRCQVLQSSRLNPIQAVTPASAAKGTWATIPAPNQRNMQRNAACSRFERRVVAPQRIAATLRAGMPTLNGAPKKSGADVGDAEGAQFAVGVAAFQELMASAEMLDHAGGQQQVDGGDDSQSKRRGEDRVGVARLPGEVRERRHGQRKRPDLSFVKREKFDRAISDQNADQGRRHHLRKAAANHGGSDHRAAEDNGRPMRRRERVAECRTAA